MSQLMVQQPPGPSRLRVRVAVKAGAPQSSSPSDGAAVTRQRVAAALGISSAPSRSRKTVTPRAAAPKARRRLATRSKALGWPFNSKTRAPTCGQARMSAPAAKASVALGARTTKSLAGSPPNSIKPSGLIPPYSRAS